MTLTHSELATAIRERFTPLVFACDCKGSHPECQSALDNPSIWSQYETVQRIAKFIEGFDK